MDGIKEVTLAFHCPETLGAGMHCDRCKRQVVDFTQKTATDLRSVVESSAGPVCGAFRRRQLSNQFLNYAAATMIATGIALPTLAQQAADGASVIACLEVSQEVENDVLLGMVVEVMPEPVGGFEKFVRAIEANMKYPPGLVEDGKVYVSFVVDTTGRLTDFSAIRGFHPLADKEAVRVLRDLNYTFKPGRQSGKAVAMRFIMPIAFKRRK